MVTGELPRVLMSCDGMSPCAADETPACTRVLPAGRLDPCTGTAINGIETNNGITVPHDELY